MLVGRGSLEASMTFSPSPFPFFFYSLASFLGHSWERDCLRDIAPKDLLHGCEIKSAWKWPGNELG